MEKIKSIDVFRYSTQFELLGTELAPSEVKFDALSLSEKKKALPKLFIEIDSEDKQIVKFEITSNDSETKCITFNNNYFTNAEIVVQSGEFGFEAMENPFFPEKLQGSLRTVHPAYKSISAIVKKYQEKYYLLIYASRRSQPARSLSEDFYGDDIYYIHGIWEVQLSEEFKGKVYE